MPPSNFEGFDVIVPNPVAQSQTDDGPQVEVLEFVFQQFQLRPVKKFSVKKWSNFMAPKVLREVILPLSSA